MFLLQHAHGFPNHESHAFQRSATLTWHHSELFCTLIKKPPHPPTKAVRNGQLPCLPVLVGLIFPGHELIRRHVPSRGKYVGGLGELKKNPNKTHPPKIVVGS